MVIVYLPNAAVMETMSSRVTRTFVLIAGLMKLHLGAADSNDHQFF